ncbi:MAG: hypothetical protein ACUVS7_18890, partial [Bryobacteraceae bacterium]
SQQPAQNKGRYEPPKYEGQRPPALPEDQDPWLLPGGVPGLPGRVRLWVATRPDMKDAKPGEWLQAETKSDFVVKTTLTGLRPARTYYYYWVINVAHHKKGSRQAAASAVLPRLAAGWQSKMPHTVAGSLRLPLGW